MLTIQDPVIRSNLEIEYLLDQTLEEAASTLEGVSRKDSVAFYLQIFSDGGGTSMTPYAVVSRLASRSAAPLYSFCESLIGSAIVLVSNPIEDMRSI